MTYKGMIGHISATQKECGMEVEWRISEFSTLSDEEDAHYESSSFSFGGHNWVLGLYPNGSRQRNSWGFIQLDFQKLSASPRTDTLHFSVSLRDVNGEKECEKTYSRCFGGMFECHTFPCSISRKELLQRELELLPSDVLTVVCTLNWRSSATSASVIPTAECRHCKRTYDTDNILLHQRKCMHRPVICPDCFETVPLQKFLDEDHECQKANARDAESLGEDFKKVFLDGCNHDMILKVGDRELRAHRDVLKARSPVFYSMLTHDMVEKKSDSIPLPDCDPNAMEQFLFYIYSGKVETLDQDSMLGLYYIADKYQVEGLKAICSDFIKKSLSEANICDVIQLAVDHSDSSLLQSAKAYFTNNMLGIMQTMEWQQFLKDNSTLANELLLKSVGRLNDKIKELES